MSIKPPEILSHQSNLTSHFKTYNRNSGIKHIEHNNFKILPHKLFEHNSRKISILPKSFLYKQINQANFDVKWQETKLNQSQNTDQIELHKELN